MAGDYREDILDARARRLEKLTRERGEPVLVPGICRDLTKEQMDAEGMVQVSPGLIKCLNERSSCVYDNSLLEEEIRNDIVVFKRCNNCGTMYYTRSKTDEKKT